MKTLLFSLLCSFAAVAADVPGAVQPVMHRIFGLFSPEREADLRELVSKIPGVTLVSVDFKSGEAAFRYDVKEAFPDTKPDKVLERFDNLVRTASNGTFGVRARCTIPQEKLERVEIGIEGLDCKACSFAAYEAVARVEGVEWAAASFKDGRVTALVDPAKTNRAALEDALTKRRVPLAGKKDAAAP